MEDNIQCETAFIISKRLNLVVPNQLNGAPNDNSHILIIENKHVLMLRSGDDVNTTIDLLLEYGIKRVIMLVVGRSLAVGVSDIWQPVQDHINWTGSNPLRGSNDRRGPRFPDMSSPYRIEHSEKGVVCAGVKNLALVSPAEEKMMKAMRADYLTDELVHPNILLNHAGISCAAFVTDTMHSLEKEDLANFISQNTSL